MPSKICSECGKEKDLSEFHNCSESSDGYKNICKSCISDYQATTYYWKKTDIEGYNEFNYSREQLIKDCFPDVSYNSFTSYISRSTDMKISELNRDDLKKEVEYWLSIKERKERKKAVEIVKNAISSISELQGIVPSIHTLNAISELGKYKDILFERSELSCKELLGYLK